MSGEESAVRFRLAGWVGELVTHDRQLLRDAREIFYEPAGPDETAHGTYRGSVDRRFGAQKRHWLSGPDSDRYLRVTPFYPSLLEALVHSATHEAAAFQGAGRQPLVAGAVSGPAGALVVVGEGHGVRPRWIQALVRSGFPFLGDGLVVVEPAHRRIVPCARALALTRPAHTMTAHGRGDRPFRNRDRQIDRYVLPEVRDPTGDEGARRLAGLLFVRAGDEPRVRDMSRGEALLGLTGSCLGEGSSTFGDLTTLCASVPACEVSIRGAKRTLELLRTERPELLGTEDAEEVVG